MPTVTDDRYLWPRVLLAVLSVGFLVVAADIVLSGLFADPSVRPSIAVLALVGLAALGGLVLATLGGVVAWAASGLYGVLVAGGVIVVLCRHADVWLSEPLIGAILLAAVGVGVTGVVIALRTAPAGREREDLWRSIVRFRGRIVAALVTALLAVGAVVWTEYSRAPQCGAAGVDALSKAAGQLREVLPALEVDPEMDAGDCGFEGTTYATWSYPGLAQLQSDGAAAGCTIGDITKYEDEPFVSCPVGRSVVLLSLDDYDGVEVSGSLSLQ